MFADEFNAEPWMQDAGCLHTDPEGFFPSVGESVKIAKRICHTACPVREECLDYAMLHRVGFGVWGGTSEYERRKVWHEINRRRRSRLPEAA